MVPPTPRTVFFALLSSFGVIEAKRNLLGVLTIRLTRAKRKIHETRVTVKLTLQNGPTNPQNDFFCSAIFFWGYYSQTQLTWGFNDSFDASETQNTRN